MPRPVTCKIGVSRPLAPPQRVPLVSSRDPRNPNPSGSAGRGLRPQRGGPRTAPEPVAPATGGMQSAGPGGATPFAGNQVHFGSNAAPSSANSFRVVSIVLGLLVMLASGVIAAIALLILALVTVYNPKAQLGTVASDDKKGHVRDTGLVKDPDLPKPVVFSGTPVPQVGPAEEKPEDMFGGLGAAPVTVYVEGPGKDVFRGVEVLCARFNYRTRAELVKDKATLAIVPVTRCKMVFQGSVPVQTPVTGGDTLRCKFNPIVCKKL